MNSCIITGATGYIGSHLLKYLLKKGWNVHIIADPQFGYDNIVDVMHSINIFEYDGNIQSLCNYFQLVEPDVVFHLAAAVITNYQRHQVPTLIQSNIQFGAEILEAMKSSGTKYFVGTGSYWQNYNSEDYNPVDLYAATKEAFEKILKYYTEVENIHAITLRLYDVYGSDDRRPKLWTLIRQKAITGETLDISAGEQLLYMVNISDVCTAYEQAYNLLSHNSDISNVIYAVRTNTPKTLKEIVNIFVRIMNVPVNIKFGGKPYKAREVMIPTSKIKIIPGWTAQVPLEDGFRNILEDDIDF